MISNFKDVLCLLCMHDYFTTLTQNEIFTLFIMGFTIPEIKTPVPPNAGNEIQSFVRMLNFIIWGVNL